MLNILLAMFLVVPLSVVVAMVGAMYCALARRTTSGREPGFTLALACGLAFIVVATGYFGHATGLQCMCVGAVSLALLLSVRFTFGITNDLEEYGVICVATIVMVIGVIGFEGLRKKWRTEGTRRPPHRLSPAGERQAIQ